MDHTQTTLRSASPTAARADLHRAVGIVASLAAVLLTAGCAGSESPGKSAAPASGTAATGAAAPAAEAIDVAKAKAGTRFSDCADCPAMVIVAPGEFTMGFEGGEPERYEGPVREMRVAKAFAAGEFEVTNAQYRVFSRETGRVATTGCYALVGSTYKSQPGKDWQDPGYGRPILDDEPVACVTWDDAKAYVGWLAGKTGKSYRLLSETEWEYVAWAGRKGRFTWGDDPTRACDEANVFDQSAERAMPKSGIPAAPCDDGFAGVAPVGRRAPNAFGLYDVIGNVWEWVEDCYTMPHTADAPRDGAPQVKNGCDRRGSRGGSWISSLERQRPAFRGRDPAERISQVFGFRVARD